jgi:predicted TIM-barrel fold metal-dependent hydrolase
MKKRLAFFDCNCLVGRRITRDEKEPYTLARLQADMDYFGIAEALVTSTLSKEYDPPTGNERLHREIRRKRRLHGCFVFTPGATGEQGPLGEALGAMLRRGVRAVRLYPKLHTFQLDEWCCGDLFDALEERGIPLFIDIEQTDWQEVAAICGRRRSLPVVVLSTGYRIARLFYPLLERFQNLHVDTSMYCPHRGLEDVCRRFGPERLLFGTKWPFHTPGPAITHITYAEISDEAKRKIAGDNLRRLLGETKQGKKYSL